VGIFRLMADEPETKC